MRADALNLQVYPVKMKMTDTKHITISYICSTDKIESE